MVSELPFDTAMVLFARLAAETWHIGTDKAGQLALAQDLFPPNAPVVDFIERFLTEHAGGAVFVKRLLLHELLAPPAYGGFIAQLARATRATVPDTEAAAAALESEGLATVRDGYTAASGRP